MEVPSSGAAIGEDGAPRCWWCGGDPLYVDYHDNEWGRPIVDDQLLFEKLCLEGFMSGLSWLTILRKRENFREAFRSFDISKIARFNERSVQRLLRDAGIVRHRGKIGSTINNARRCIELCEEAGSLAAYAWSFEPEPATRPSKLDWPSLEKLGPSAEATAMSNDLKRRGWSFVGPTTVYSFMEAVGIVNDHVTACVVREEVEITRREFARPGT